MPNNSNNENNKNSDKTIKDEDKKQDTSSKSDKKQGGTHEQHVKAGEQSHKNTKQYFLEARYIGLLIFQFNLVRRRTMDAANEILNDWLRDAHAMEKQALTMLQGQVDRLDN